MNKTPQWKLEANKRWRDKNKDTIAYNKRNSRLRRFGLTPESLVNMLEDQDSVCMICKEGPLELEGKINLSVHIDHCHSCGEVRGLLCKRCNMTLGFIEKDVDKFGKIFMFYIDHHVDHEIAIGRDVSE